MKTGRPKSADCFVGLEGQGASSLAFNLLAVSTDKQTGASESRVAAARVAVPGVKRVWGTKKDASTTVVLRTIR